PYGKAYRRQLTRVIDKAILNKMEWNLIAASMYIFF
ncbi:unnamed protein product, partial [Urochloa humidicola]